MSVKPASSGKKNSPRSSATSRSKASHAGDNLATVTLPVTCAQCGLQSLVDFPELVIVTALTRWGHMNLYAPCHDTPWNAQPHEIDAIREYLGEAWIMGALARTGLSPPDRQPRH